MINKNTRIFITGGHATPAIACIEELKKRGFQNLVYISQKKSIIFDKNVSSEYRQITEKIQIPFKSIYAGKISKYFGLSALIWFFRIPIGFIQALWYQITLRPQVILTFGSHIGIPVVFWAWAFHKKIIAHEQTVIIGKANTLIQRLATKVCFSWDQSYLPKSNNSKFILTGNPVRKEILDFSPNFPFKLKSNAPLLFITGGNQGAHIINEFIFKHLEILLEKYNIIHQTGSNTLFNDLEKAKIQEKKFETKPNTYLAEAYFFADTMAQLLHKAEIIISRSGANNITEFLIHQKKCILIPIPNSKGNEQYLNAKLMEGLGLALILEQKKLDEIASFDFISLLTKLLKENITNPDQIKNLSSLHQEAAKNVIDVLA